MVETQHHTELNAEEKISELLKMADKVLRSKGLFDDFLPLAIRYAYYNLAKQEAFQEELEKLSGTPSLAPRECLH